MDIMDSKIKNNVNDFRDCFRKFLRIKDEGEVASQNMIDCYQALYIYARDFVESYEEWQKEKTLEI